MNKPTLNEFLAALQSEPYDPFWLAREHVESRKAEDRAYHRQTDETIALCKRVGEQLDSVPGLLMKMVVP